MTSPKNTIILWALSFMMKKLKTAQSTDLQQTHLLFSVIMFHFDRAARYGTVWPGNLNGDGKFDFVIDRNCEDTQKVEGYLSDGTFLWEIELGHNRMNRDNIKLGATTINVGHWDGVNVYDLDGDGKAEVYLRIANNVIFGDGYTFLNNGHDENCPYDDSEEWMACVDGMTGKLKHKVK